MPYHLNLLVDPELERALKAHAKGRGMHLSAAVRDLLVHALGVVGSESEAGWREGYQRGVAEVMRTVQTALKNMPTPK